VTTDRGESAEHLVVPKDWRRRLLPLLLLVFCAAGGAGSIACHSRKPETTPRYHLTGKISDVNRSGKYVLVEQDDIPGFMPAMMMSYSVMDPHALDKLSAGDQISADVIVGHDGAKLENIAILKKGASEARKPSS
jgi:Cu/Ag efflux protein CusF